MSNVSQASPDFSLQQSKWSFIGNIHPFSVIFIVVLLAATATFFVPGGTFERQEVDVIGMTREVIIPGSFQSVESVPQGFAEVWTYFMQGAVEASDIIFTIFLCAGALTAIIHTGAITSFIHVMVQKLKGNAILLIPITVFCFSLGGAVYGMYEDAVPFILVIVPLMLMMGYDSTLAVMIVQLGCVVGSSACFLNPFAVGIGQALAEVPMTSGIGVRMILWFCMTAGTSLYITLYAMKIKKNPHLSISYVEDQIKAQNLTTSQQVTHEFSWRHKLVLILLALGFAIMIIGVMRFEWWFNEIGSIFLIMGVVIPLIGGTKLNALIDQFTEGMSTMITAAMLLAASRIIFYILTNSFIMDTLLNGISVLLGELPDVITVWLMYIVSSISMTIVNSSSGLAATLMPIMAPLSDVLGIPRQMAVTAYQLSTSTFGFWMPWDGITFAMCSLAGVNFFKYLKRCAHYVFTFYIPASLIALTVLTLVGFK